MAEGSTVISNVDAVAIARMARRCYESAEMQGFHDKGKASTLEIAMLIVTECAELAEWERNGRGQSNHIPEFTGAEEELADILIRVFDHSIHMGIEPEKLGQAFDAKLAFNATRGYRHGGKSI